MKYRIGIDTRMLHHSGIGTYLQGLLEGLSHLKIPAGEFQPFGAGTSEFSASIYSLAEQFQYPSRLAQCKLWHSPHYNIPVFKGKTRLVVTIHDLIHWIFRKDFFTPLQAAYAGFMLRRCVTTADHILTVSEKTKEDLVRYFRASPEKISVIYEGVGAHFRALQDPEKIRAVRKKYELPESFFLTVGNLKPHKNVHALLRVFRKAKKEGMLQASLVIVGKKDRRYRPQFKELAQLKTGNGIHYIPYAEGEDLVTLYNAALALVHPSLYEGFGLTLLEAMACGLPVIACRTSAIPEIAGEAALLVQPHDDEAMGQAMRQIETNPALRRELILKGNARAALFSWDSMAQKTHEIYNRVLNGN